MKATASVIAIVLLAAACSGSSASEDTTIPLKLATPPTTEVQTTTLAPTTTATTSTTTTSTTTVPKRNRAPSPFHLEPLAANPIIERSSESGGTMLPEVELIDGRFHMWFTETEDWSSIPEAIYHATSDDGMTWTVDDEPALTGDGSGFDAFAVAEARVVEDGDGGWVMFYNAMEAPRYGAPGTAIGRARADSPFGPWTAEPDPVLTIGASGAWDAGFVLPASAVWFDDQILLFYSGGRDLRAPGWSTGLVKIDGEALTQLPDAVIRPVRFWNGTAAWEPAVFLYDEGPGAFLSGVPSSMEGESIGYVWSPDGVTWTEAEDNPILKPEESWAALFVLASSVVELPDGRRMLYYSGTATGPLDFSIGAAEVIPAN